MNHRSSTRKVCAHLERAKSKNDLMYNDMAAAGALAAMAGQQIWKHKSSILDGATRLVPKLKGPRKVIKDIFGFRSRQASTGKNARRKAQRYGKGRGGATIGNTGAIVKTVNAPVAFARTFTGAPGFYIKHLDADTILVHSVDFVDTVYLEYDEIGQGMFRTAGYQIEPSNEDVFTYLNPLLILFAKWKLAALKVHYVHYAPTSQSGAVAITWDPDVDGNPPANMEQQLNTNGAVSGACYEDFAYECNPGQFNKDWFYMSDQGGPDEDNRLVTEGEVQISTDQGGDSTVNSTKAIGRVIFESEWILTSRRPSQLMTLFSKMRRVAKTNATPQAKKAAMESLAQQMLDVCSPKKHKQSLTLEEIMDGKPRVNKPHAPPPPTPSITSGAITPINGRR